MILCLVGFRGTGKSAFAKRLVEDGKFGAWLEISELKKAISGREANSKKELQKLEVSKHDLLNGIVSFISTHRGENVVVSGCREVCQTIALKKVFKGVVVVGLVAGFKERYVRSGAGLTETAFRELDDGDLAIGVGRVLANCDAFFVAEGDFTENYSRLIESINDNGF
jgi:hypothetical protein